MKKKGKTRGKMNKKQENRINDKKRLKFHKLAISHALCSNGSLYVGNGNN